MYIDISNTNLSTHALFPFSFLAWDKFLDLSLTLSHTHKHNNRDCINTTTITNLYKHGIAITANIKIKFDEEMTNKPMAFWFNAPHNKQINNKSGSFFILIVGRMWLVAHAPRYTHTHTFCAQFYKWLHFIIMNVNLNWCRFNDKNTTQKESERITATCKPTGKLIVFISILYSQLLLK